MLDKEFYEFMRKRETIRLRRLAGLPRDQWTDDPILQQYRFTNVKREHDRTTQRLLAEFYPPSNAFVDPIELIVNCTIARFFGLFETAKEIGYQASFGHQSLDHHIRAVVADRQVRRQKIFTSAYIVPNCGDSDPKSEVVIRIVDEVDSWARDQGHPFLTRKDASWRLLIQSLCSHVRGMGSFMAKEVVLDWILVLRWEPPDWHDWTPIGPGARRGAARVAGDGSLIAPLSEPSALEVARRLLPSSELYWYDRSLWPADCQDEPVAICLTDIQFQLCEFDKYLRAVSGTGRPKSRFVPFSEER